MARRAGGSAATKVWLCQWPNGAWSTSRSPTGAQPVSLIMLVFTSRWLLLVHKGEPFKMVAHEALAPADPEAARQGDIGPGLLSRAQGFFCG